MLLVQAQNFYERVSGVKHQVSILFQKRRCYIVEVDGEFWSTAETRGEAFDEVVDILKVYRWSPVPLV